MQCTDTESHHRLVDYRQLGKIDTTGLGDKGDNAMTLKARDYVEYVGIAAVVASLLLLVFEIRQNTLAVQSTALQQHFAQHTNLILARLDNSQLQESIRRGAEGLDTLSDEDYGLYGPYASNAMRNHFVAFELMRSGLLPERQWKTFEAALGRSLQRSLGDRELWVLRRDEYPEDFRELVDRLISNAESSLPE